MIAEWVIWWISFVLNLLFLLAAFEKHKENAAVRFPSRFLVTFLTMLFICGFYILIKYIPSS